MSDPIHDRGEEGGIEAGKRLVRSRDQGGMSLGERLANQFYRLTWRTPFHRLRLRGRHPLKLLAAPQDPITVNACRGEAILEGELRFAAHVTQVDECDFGENSLSLLHREYLQSFDWLRDLEAVADKNAARTKAEWLMQLWLDQFSGKVVGLAWRPDIWGRRILNWGTHAPLILAKNDLVYRSAVLNAMARGARHIDRAADRAPAGVARVAAWSGVVAASLLIPDGEARQVVGEAGLQDALKAAVFADGGSSCRAPINLLEILKYLSLLGAIYTARKIDFPAHFDEVIQRTVPALLAVIMGDGGLGSWQGGMAIAGDDVNAIIRASQVRARPLRQARDWGYQRLSAGSTHVVMDAAPPPLSRVAVSGCASTLAIEVSDGRDRLIVNCGGSRTAGAVVPTALAVGLRTTAAHSTLILADSNSTAVHNDGQLGKGVEQIELDRQETTQLSRIIASHDGYEKRLGLIHKRSLALSHDGREIRCDDTLLPGSSRRKPQQSTFAIRFHLGPAVEASPTADGFGALLRIEDGPVWQFKATGGAVTIDDSLWIDGDGNLYNTQQVVVSGEAPAGGASISWVMKRAS